MEEYKEKQFQIEHDHIMSKYFSDMKLLTDFEPVKNRPVFTCELLLNGKPYVAYKYELSQTIFVPKMDNIFDGDFDNIYELSVHKDENIVLLVTRKKNGIIESFGYDFRTNNTYSIGKNCVEIILHYSSIDDSKNQLKEKFLSEKKSLEVFLIRDGLRSVAFPAEHKIINIIKKSSGFSYKSIYTSIEELFKDYVNETQIFEPIEIENDASLMETAEKLIAEPSKEKTKK